MANQIFFQTSSNRYALISPQNQLNANPPEYSQTNGKNVKNKMPKNYGLVGTQVDNYSLISKKNQLNSNPAEFTGNSKVIVTSQYTRVAYPSILVDNKSMSIV
jgi:hypothetical protein